MLVAPIRLMMTSKETSGLPRQLWLTKLQSRCSILFHLLVLLVLGGKWQTEISRPVSSARRCSSVFQRWVRLPLEPPQSAVIVSVLASG